MFPDEEFLPRVPDPEDVITEDAENPPSQPFPDEAPEDQGPAAEATENQSTDEAGITHETETTPSPAQWNPAKEKEKRERKPQQTMSIAWLVTLNASIGMNGRNAPMIESTQ